MPNGRSIGERAACRVTVTIGGSLVVVSCAFTGSARTRRESGTKRIPQYEWGVRSGEWECHPSAVSRHSPLPTPHSPLGRQLLIRRIIHVARSPACPATEVQLELRILELFAGGQLQHAESEAQEPDWCAKAAR